MSPTCRKTLGRPRCRLPIAAAAALSLAAPLRAQTTVGPPATAPAPASAQATRPGAGGGAIELDFPDNVQLKVLIRYVSERLGVNIYYDEQAVAQQVTIRAPVPVPESSLLGLLEGVLRAKGLALVDDEQPGFKRIIPAANLPQAAQFAPAGGAGRPGRRWSRRSSQFKTPTPSGSTSSSSRSSPSPAGGAS